MHPQVPSLAVSSGGVHAPSLQGLSALHVTVSVTPPLQARSVRSSTHVLTQPPSTGATLPASSTAGTTQSPLWQMRAMGHTMSWASPAMHTRTTLLLAQPAWQVGPASGVTTSTHIAFMQVSSAAHVRLKVWPSTQKRTTWLLLWHPGTHGGGPASTAAELEGASAEEDGGCDEEGAAELAVPDAEEPPCDEDGAADDGATMEEGAAEEDSTTALEDGGAMELGAADEESAALDDTPGSDVAVAVDDADEPMSELDTSITLLLSGALVCARACRGTNTAAINTTGRGYLIGSSGTA